MPGPLHGVKAIEFTEIIAGPLQEILGRLMPRMDVALVNYRPDVVSKLGLECLCQWLNRHQGATILDLAALGTV